MARKHPAPHPVFLLTLVALSGAAGLCYELLWIRALGRHFGTSTPAIATVVATFMAGLGIGYVWFGKRADGSARPYRLYQRLELCIALTGLAVSVFLLRGGSWLDALARMCAAAGPLSLLCTVVVLAALMLIPTTAMGGTVPVLASALAREGHAGRGLSLLYASNTLGAIAGALGPDFVLIPRFGMTVSACVAAALNLAIALAAGRFTRSERVHAGLLREGRDEGAAGLRTEARANEPRHDVAAHHQGTVAQREPDQQVAFNTDGAIAQREHARDDDASHHDGAFARREAARQVAASNQEGAFARREHSCDDDASSHDPAARREPDRQVAASYHDGVVGQLQPTRQNALPERAGPVAHRERDALEPGLVGPQRAADGVEHASGALEREAGVTRLSPQRAAAMALSASTGFCALGLEVLWSRTLQHWAAALVTSFSVLLAMYLGALASGAFLTERLAARTRRPLTAACALTTLTALAAALPLWAAPVWRDVARSLWPRPAGVRRVGLAHEAIDALLHAGFLELAPCLAMGATFPFIAAAWLAQGKVGTRSGQLFIVNTFSGVLGTLVVGFWWLPRLGEQASYLALALVLAGVAALCAVVVARSERTAFAAVSCVLGGAGVVALACALPDSQLLRAHFRSGGDVLAIKQGATTTAAVAARYLYGEPHYLELLTPGTSMSSTRGDARRYMSVMAHAAMLSAQQPERALLICYGVGNTAHALLAHPGLQRLDVVDTSSEVLALSGHFATARASDPLRDPRTHVFIDDGRHHLITHDARYDVITAEPPPPNHAGVSNLYSREFYRSARNRLAAGGVITQWLPVFQLSDADVRAMIAAFVAELPHSALLYGWEQQLVLIGSNEPPHMRGNASEALRRELQASYIGSSEHLLGSVIQTDAELRRLIQHVEPLSDDRPTLQYPREDVPEGTYFTSTFASKLFLPRDVAAVDERAASGERTQRAAAATAHALAALPLRELSPPEARELALGSFLTRTLRDNPDDQGLWALLAVDSDRARLAERALQREGAAALLAKPLAQVSTNDRARFLVLQDAALMLARRSFYAGDYARALDLLQRVQPDRADQARHWLLIAGCLRALQQHEASARAYIAAAAASGDPTFRETCTKLASQAARRLDPEQSPWTLSD